MEIPELTTERLLMEPITWKHSPGMYALWSNSNVCRYSGEACDIHGDPVLLPARSRHESDRILEYFIEHQRTATALRWAMIRRSDVTFVGAVGFNAIGRCSEIAFHLHPNHWGTGLMMEACAAAIEWARSRVRADVIEAFVDPQNGQSIRLLGRLGFDRDEWRDGTVRYLLHCRLAR